jgi:hypothetical protein
MAIQGGYWASKDQIGVFCEAISNLAREQDTGTARGSIKPGLRGLPSVFVLYASGVAALSHNRYDNLHSLFCHSQLRDREQPRSFVLEYPWEEWFEWFRTLPGRERQFVPQCEWLFESLREPLRVIVRADQDYDELFDRFEYLLALTHVDLKRPEADASIDGGWWGPLGRFARKYRFADPNDNTIMTRLKQEITNAGNDAPLLQAGFFGGSADRFQNVLRHFENFRVSCRS